MNEEFEILGVNFTDESEMRKETIVIKNIEEQWEDIQDNLDQSDLLNIIHEIGINGNNLLDALEYTNIVEYYDGQYYILEENYL